MTELRQFHLPKLAAVALAVFALSACASQKDVDALNMKVDELNEKLNAVSQTASAAKVDATTALMIAIENEKK